MTIRGLVWAAPVIAAWQPGCTTLHSSCDGFQSERREARAPLSSATSDDGGDGGTVDPLASDEACRTFCEQHAAAFGTGFDCRAESEDGGTIIVCSFNTVCEGRRPEGFRAPAPEHDAPILGRYFAAMAAGEAASVAAFERLGEELAALDMPRELVRRARHAARQESRHFGMTAALARRFGAAAKAPALPTLRKRNVVELAHENAREGVVRETFGAVAGCWQARHATERSVRAVMRRIASDETSHAELSWAIDMALRERMSPRQQSELDMLASEAVEHLTRELDAEVDAELVVRAGLPNRRVTRALLEAARAELWN
jgi:hypothetical protein